MITQILLNDDARGLSSLLKPRGDGIAFQGLDVQGSVREVTDDTPEQDGATDLTQFAGAAAVTLTLKFYGQFRALMDEIDQFCVPYARPYLQVTDDEWPGDRILRLRYSTANKPLVRGTGSSRTAAYQWKAPAGVWEDAAAVTYMIPGVTGASGGLHFASTTGVSVNATTFIDFGPSSVSADSIVTVTGTMRPPWVARLYGPCTGPQLFDDTAGTALVFTDDLVLAAGEYVEVSSAARSANFLSAPDQSRLSYLDWDASRWFDLVPGDNLLRYAPDLPSSGCACQLTFTPRRMA